MCERERELKCEREKEGKELKPTERERELGIFSRMGFDSASSSFLVSNCIEKLNAKIKKKN